MRAKARLLLESGRLLRAATAAAAIMASARPVRSAALKTTMTADTTVGLRRNVATAAVAQLETAPTELIVNTVTDPESGHTQTIDTAAAVRTGSAPLSLTARVIRLRRESGLSWSAATAGWSAASKSSRQNAVMLARLCLTFVHSRY